ncbi:MAG: heme-binding protein [Kineothrix sp.]|jgi:uncharacterized protein GlcG (DUF336 family)|nr:hypothetical protein C807_00385 [Lachnospiraceae bacterium 28-4]MCI8846812.1 heme-binding protein [Lachnospiraceae bacterium]MCX4343775.1 heme-binding protein [Kineothrix sp.]
MNEELICQVVEKAVREAGKAVMTLETAKKLIDMVEKKAEEMGIAVIIAVADKAARPVAIHCMDDAYIASFDIALNKAYTSAGLKMSTAELSRLSGPGQPLYGIQHTNEGKIVIFGGGEVLEANGRIAGALGVSGGTLEQDTYLAAYGREVFARIE